MSNFPSLIPSTIDGESVQTINARDLYESLESKADFSTWIKTQIERARLVEDRDYIVFHKKVENLPGGRPRTDYHLTIEAAKHIAMMSGTDKGFQVREYFIECERNLKKVKIADAVPKKAKLGPSATEKKLMMDCYKLVINELPNLGAASKQLLLSATVAGVFGESLLPKPEVAKSYSAEQIANELGTSAQMIGRIANSNGLKTDENGAYVLDQAKHCSSKQVEAFRYNEAGRAAVIEAFNKRKNANENAANESATEEVA